MCGRVVGVVAGWVWRGVPYKYTHGVSTATFRERKVLVFKHTYRGEVTIAPFGADSRLAQLVRACDC